MKNFDKLRKSITDSILEKKGKEVIQINLERLDEAPCDCFIICHGDTGIQGKTIAESIERNVKNNLNIQFWHREGMDVAKWILLDYGSIVVHIFQKETRDYYKLEELWGDGDIEAINDELTE